MGMISGPGSRWLITLQVAFPRLWISILRVWYSHQSYSILFNLEMHTLCIPHSYNEFRYRWAWSVTTVTLHGWRGQAQRPSIYGVITDALEIHVVLVPFWPKQKKCFWDRPWNYLPDTRLSQIGRFGFDQGYCLGNGLQGSVSRLWFFVSALISLIAVQTVPTMHAMWGSGTGLWTGIMASNGLRWEWYFWPACIEFEICSVVYKF